MDYLLIGLGGFLGANARYLVASWTAQLWRGQFPLGTFLANISGSCLLGVLMGLLQDQPAQVPHYRLFFAIGFLGAYTTFSTFSFETLRLLQDGFFFYAVLNIGGSIGIGLVGVFLGFLLGSMIR